MDAARLVEMPSQKYKGRVHFLSATGRRKKLKKSLSSNWAENLVESNTGAMVEGVERAAKHRIRMGPISFHMTIYNLLKI